MHRRVWAGLRNSVRSAALKAMKSPTWWPRVWVMVTRWPARIRHVRAWPAGITSSLVSVVMGRSPRRSGAPVGGGVGRRRRLVVDRMVRGTGAQQPPEERPRALLARPAEHLGRRALLDDAAAVHEEDAIADLAGEVQLVGDDDHRHPRA